MSTGETGRVAASGTGAEGGIDILIATLRYPPYVTGGYELLTRDAVVALRERGYDIRVLAGKGSRFASEPDVLPWLEPELDGEDPMAASMHASGREKLRLHFLRKANLEATTRAIETLKPKLFFYFNLGLVSLAPILAARRARIPTLGYLSDPWIANYWLIDWKASGRKPLRCAALSFLWKRLRSYVGTGPVLCCSQHLLERLERDGLEPGSGSVLPLGVPPDVEARTRELAVPRRETDHPLRVACISALWLGKGQHVLLKALARAKEQGRSIEVWMAARSGTDEYRSQLERIVREAGIEDAIEFKPELSRAQLAEELQRSHVLCVPSVWDEPFPLSTLEGLAHGLAVCVSSAGGCPEAIQDGVDGRVFHSGDDADLARVLMSFEEDEPARYAQAKRGLERSRTRLAHSGFIDGLERAIATAAAGSPGNMGGA